MIQIESFGINDSYKYGPLSEMLFLISEYEVIDKWWHETLIMYPYYNHNIKHSTYTYEPVKVSKLALYP